MPEFFSSQQIIANHSDLSDGEKAILAIAAAGDFHGGDSVRGMFLDKAKSKGLVYKSTGRLKPVILSIYVGDTPTMVRNRR